MPGAKYAVGSQAWGECNRCGLRFLLSELVFDGYMPGLRVCGGCYDDKHPQEFLVDVTDPIAVWKPAPQSVEFIAPVLTLVSAGATVKIAWTPANFEAYTVGSYQVYRRITGSATYTLLATFKNVENIFADGKPKIAQTLSYTDSAVSPSTSYDYYVQASSLGSSSLAAHTVASNVLTVAVPLAITITMNSSDNSNTPIVGQNGQGWYDGTFGLPNSCGFLVSSSAFGPTVINGIFNDTNVPYFYVVVTGTQPQNLFNQASFTDNIAQLETYLTANATWSTSLFPGFTSWRWPAQRAFPFHNGSNYPVAFS